MARGPSTTSKKDGAGAAAEEKAEEVESKRLRDLAFSRALLSRFRATPASPLWPSKALLKADGKDIVKKGHRKTKYLFSFPGLVAPISGGRLGELTNLDSRNPNLYIDFPQGRLKLFGTIVYPKNKYLTLQFPKGTGNIICEDCFESLVVFSECWWIGTKQENPDELRLDWPKALMKDKYADVDFTAGAGRTRDSAKNAEKDEYKTPEKQFKLDIFPEPESGDDFQDDRTAGSIPVRQSARTAGKMLNYADSISQDEEDGDANEDNDESDSSEHFKNKIKKESAIKSKNTIYSSDDQRGETSSILPIILDTDDDTAKEARKTIVSSPLTQNNLVLETRKAKNSESVFVTSNLSGMDVSSTILKQSSLTSFLGKSSKKEDTDTGQPLAAVTSRKDIIEVSVKQATSKRPRKVLSTDDKEDASSERGRKQLKHIKGMKHPEGSVVTPKSISSIRKQIQDGKGNSKKGDKGFMPKVEVAAKRKNTIMPKNKGESESNEDSLDAIESDDSDEDWVA